MTNIEQIRELLPVLPASGLDYASWLLVGMAMHHEGCSLDEWNAWSSTDARFDARVNERKWRTFGRGGGKPVAIGTLVDLAKQHGYTPARREGGHHEKTGHCLSWDATIGGGDKQRFQCVDSTFLENVQLVEPADDWDQVYHVTSYLRAVFSEDDFFGYNMEARYLENRNKWVPANTGCYDRTAGQVIDQLSRCKGDIGAVLGDYNQKAGAWIRINPLDGEGARDENVTEFRATLIESDTIPVERQFAIVNELQLPCLAQVVTGNKSGHSIVRVDARNMEEYRERVKFIREVLNQNGMELDASNGNPSRLSRLPGVYRDGRKQYLVSVNTGLPSFDAWREHIEDLNDDLPDIEDWPIDATEPELAPELIAGVLREGHKLMIAGPSKAGKSFALAQLCLAASEGGQWLGWPVKRGRVLYVNLELDARSSRHRGWKICEELGLNRTPGMLDHWNLRGHATSLDKLAPKLIRRAQKKNYAIIVVDPIYKVLTGDENSASEMANFCNQFDKIAHELGAAVVVCHHHSKGEQGQKSSQDRSSGSGVFARDPDAIIDFIELQIDEARRDLICNRWECDAITTMLDAEHSGWRSEISQDDALVADRLAEWCNAHGYGDFMREVRYKAHEAAMGATAWRIEGTLREFPKFKPRRFFYRYPLHIEDTDELLLDAKAAGEMPYNQRQQKSAEPKQTPAEKRQKQLAIAIGSVQLEGLEPTLENVAINAPGKNGKGHASVRTIRRWIDESNGEWILAENIVKRGAETDA